MVGGGSAVARVDTSGNVKADSDLTPYVGAEYDVPLLTYLGGPDGTLWNAPASTAVVSDAADAQTSGDLDVSDWQSPSGNSGNAHRAAKNVKFVDSDTKSHCGGFDGNVKPRIVVVAVNRSNLVLLQIKKNWENVTLQSDTPSVTFSPLAPSGKSTPLTINGGSTPILARIKAFDGTGRLRAVLRVAVKAQTAPTVLDLYPATEANENLIGSAATQADVLNELTVTFGKHANAQFTVNPQSSLSVAYDLNNDGKLEDFSKAGNYTEVSAINSYISQHGGINGDIWVSYVHDINPSQVEGMTNAIPGKAEWIRNNTASGQAWVTAHETGHALGLCHPDDSSKLCLGRKYSDVQDLMNSADTGKSPCRLHVDQWNKLNPTGDSNLPKQWELAPPQPQDRQ